MSHSTARANKYLRAQLGPDVRWVWKEEVSTSLALADTYRSFKIKLDDNDEDGVRFLHGRHGAEGWAGLLCCWVENWGPGQGPCPHLLASWKAAYASEPHHSILWAFVSPLNGWDCPCVLGWIDVISKACNSFQEGTGRIKLEIFFYWEEKLNISGNLFMKMFLYFSVSPEHSDLNTSQDCARLEGMKTKWI